ncbi:MAG TPA: hypothetical protein VGA89_02270 [Patescibacteria group bacterium]|jgi:hypothetical protein
MKKFIKLYYLLLILLISSQAIFTVYRLSGTISQGKKLSQLQRQQTEMEEELRILEEKHFSQNSLTRLASQTEDYWPIQKPIVLTKGESVASR